MIKRVEARVVDEPVDGAFEAQGNALEGIEQASAWGVEAGFPIHAGVAFGEGVDRLFFCGGGCHVTNKVFGINQMGCWIPVLRVP